VKLDPVLLILYTPFISQTYLSVYLSVCLAVYPMDKNACPLWHYQSLFMDWWNRYHHVHCLEATRGRPLPNDRAYHWSNVDVMDDDIVLQLFVIYCDQQMPYAIWFWFHQHMNALRLYLFQMEQRTQSLLRAENKAESERKLQKMAPHHHYGEHSYTYWGTMDNVDTLDTLIPDGDRVTGENGQDRETGELF